MSDKPRVGFIGLGIMGGPMAANLLRAGFSLTVYNRTRSKAEALLKAGAVASRSPEELASLSDVVIAMVTDGPDVEQVLFGPEGAAKGMRRGSVFVDMGTNSPDYARSFASRLRELGADFLDAPVTGGDVGARSGTLTIMVGGEREVFERVRPVFDAMGKTVVYAGPAGSGQALKLANQVGVGLGMLALVEAMALAKKEGVPQEALFQVLSTGGASSFTVQAYMPRLMRGDMEPGFKAAHLKKDLKHAIDAAHAEGVALPGTALTLQLYNALCAAGMGEKGTQSLAALYETLMGLRQDPKDAGLR